MKGNLVEYEVKMLISQSQSGYYGFKYIYTYGSENQFNAVGDIDLSEDLQKIVFYKDGEGVDKVVFQEFKDKKTLINIYLKEGTYL